jgi:hypothetical protein
LMLATLQGFKTLGGFVPMLLLQIESTWYRIFCFQSTVSIPF